MNKFYYSDRFYRRQQNETSGEMFIDFKRIIENTTCVNIFGHCGELVGIKNSEILSRPV